MQGFTIGWIEKSYVFCVCDVFSSIDAAVPNRSSYASERKGEEGLYSFGGLKDLYTVESYNIL